MEKAKQDAFDRARLQVIKDGYERAFECINKGLSSDEAGHKAQALEFYRQGRQHLLRALSVPSRGDECVGASWDSARQMQQKMQETLDNITTRLAVIETSQSSSATTVSNGSVPQKIYPAVPQDRPDRPAPPQVLNPSAPPAGGAVGEVPSSSSTARGAAPRATHASPGLPQNRVSCDQPPAYSPQAADGHVSISYGTTSGELSMVGDEFYSHTSNSAPSPQSLGEDGEELFFLPQGVQIFFVTPDGQVSAPSYPGYLRIVRFTNEASERVPGRPPAFLQVCDWLYPLMAMDSPVLLCNTGVYMFPDMMAPSPGSYVGVVLSSELPLSERELFQDLLSQMTDLRVQVSSSGPPSKLQRSSTPRPQVCDVNIITVSPQPGWKSWGVN